MPVTIILWKPEHPGNLGRIARLCENFGHSDVRLIDPQFDPLCLEARNLAVRAQDTLKNFQVVEESVLGEFDTVVMTHGRESFSYNMKRSMITPDQLVENMDERSTCIVFGPEAEGIPPDMLKHADIVLTIPTQREYPSMNLSMAVGIILYELAKAQGEKGTLTERFAPMKAEHRDIILQFVDDILEPWEFPSESAEDTMRMVWRRMIGRAYLTEREAYALLGFLKRCKGER